MTARSAVAVHGALRRRPTRRFQSLFNEAPVGIVFLNLADIVVDCNDAFLKPLGLGKEAVIGRPFAERVSREDREDVAGQLSKLVMGTTRAARLDGLRMPGFGEQFAQAQKMQAVGQLAGGIAYDFNNLLTAMLGFCDLLLARHGPSDPSFDDIVQIRQNAIRASNLVRQLLAFSRKQALKPVPHDVNQALAQLSAMLGRLLGPRVELRLERADHLGRIRVDPGQFDRVIINLAVNARDAMPEGGVLTIRTLPAVVREPVHRGAEVMPPGRYALIQVSDTGIGMAKEIIGNIFEPFFSTKEVGAGTGLGLSTVYGIVRQTGGFSFVDSAPGEGATFSVYLPPEPEDAGGAEAAAKEATSALNNDWTGAGTVLLVEDEEAVRVLAARALRNHGYRVLEATDGETALELMGARNTAVDLIVTDMVMPGMDGPTLVRRIRQELGSVKVILMSGYMEERMDAADGEAPIHFLQKPFTLGELAGKVKDVLAR